MSTLREILSEVKVVLDNKFLSSSLLDEVMIKYALDNSKTLSKGYYPMTFTTADDTKSAAADIIEKLTKRGAYEFYSDDNRHIFIFTEGVVDVYLNERSKSIDCSGTFTDRDLKNVVIDATRKYQKERKAKSTVYTIIEDHGKLQLQYLSQFGDYSFERDNYEDSVVGQFEHIVEELATPNPCGRLVVVNGAPGTGKTNYIKGLINQSTKCNFIIVPFSAHQLSNPSMVNLITSSNTKNEDGTYRPMVFVLEDADSALIPRGADNISDISTLLNLSDGVLGHMLDLRIIATTNAKTIDMDKALIRNGRLCQMVNIDELSERQANVVWSRLTNADAAYTSKSRVLADIYAAAKNKVVHELRNKKANRVVGFGAAR